MRVIALVTAGQRVGIVDEDKLIDVELGLGRAPGLPSCCNILALLLRGVTGLFLSVTPSASSVAHMVATHTVTPRLAADHSTSSARVASGCVATCAIRASRW
jgi:hypothetical protein